MTSKHFKLHALTAAAKSALSNLIRTRNLQHPVFTITRAKVASTGQVKWGIGTYERENLGPDVDIETLDGFDFCFDEFTDLGENRVVLDFRNGSFTFGEKEDG